MSLVEAVAQVSAARKPVSTGSVRTSTEYEALGSIMLQPAWMGAFRSGAEWQAQGEHLRAARDVALEIDDRLIYSRRPFTVRAFCAYCGGPRDMRIDWTFAGNGGGEIWPAWTETASCTGCSLNSRQRAVYDLAANVIRLRPDAQIYLSERVTLGYTRWVDRFSRLIGSEFIGQDRTPGSTAAFEDFPDPVRHEDLTRLSFARASCDAIVTQDVFEHLPDYTTAFRECARVIKPGGHLVFSIPFFPDRFVSEICARLNPDGSIEHILPPEYHGNPVSQKGSLCFQHFGWDILDCLRGQGFRDACAHLYWAPWRGHFGMPFFTFQALR